jgi:hypothetical protein
MEIEDTVITNIKDTMLNIEKRDWKNKDKECTLCHKQVSKSNMNRHMKGSNCINKDYIRKKRVTEIESLTNRIKKSVT